MKREACSKDRTKTVCFVSLNNDCRDESRRMLDDNLESISVLRGYYPEHVDPFSKEKPSLGLWATTISSEMPAEWNRSVWNFSTSDRASLPLGTEPDLFFISCYSGLLKTCLNCIEWIRDSLPDALIIVGGGACYIFS